MPTSQKSNLAFERFPKKETIIAIALSIIYLLWVSVVVGFRNDHLIFLTLCLTLFFAHNVSRKVILALIFFVIYWIVYDSTRIYPNYLFNPVHIQDLYEWEKSWFGIQSAEGIITPNEFFATRTNTVLDVFSGLFYLCWVPVPIAFAIWLFFKDKKLLLEFSFAFLLCNLIGFVIYYLYPAAAPWYVELHGFEKNFEIPGNEAGLAKFDEFFGVPLFNSMYAKNANVFAAVPSLHSAYPVVTLYYGLKKRLKLGSFIFFVILVGIWFTAVYSGHHYIIDVILGAFCAVATIIIIEKILMKTRMKEWMERYSVLI